MSFGFGGPLKRFGLPGLAALDDNDPFSSGPRRQPQAEYRRPLEAEPAEGMTRNLLNHGASGLQYVFGSLNKAGRAARAIPGGKPHELLAAIPFSDTLGITDERDAVSGRDLTDQAGLTTKGDNGWGAWGIGLAADTVTDPLTYASFGTKAALTAAGKAASKAGTIGKLSRVQRINQGLSGLAGVGLPFRDPAMVFGTGAKAAQVAGGLDKATDFLKYGTKPGRMLGAAFDYRRGDAADKITQKAMANYGTPAREAAEAVGRQQHAGFLGPLNKLIAEGAHPERDILSAARAAAEGHPGLGFDPGLWNKVQPIGQQARQFGQQQLAEARRLGLPLKDAADPFAGYVPRSALAIPVHGQQLRPGNIVPTSSGANISRDSLYREIPGGTEQFNQWAKKYAGIDKNDVALVGGQIRKDMDDILNASGTFVDQGMSDALDQKALDVAGRISKLDPKYKDLGGFFSPDLAGDLTRRSQKHSKTVGSANAIYGAVKENARPMGQLPLGSVSLPDLMDSLKLVTSKGSKKAGVKAEGALVQALDALGVDSSKMPFSNRRLRKKAKGFGVTAEHADQLTRQYNAWKASPTITEPLAGFDSLTNAFKNMAYSIWPAAHMRNAMSAGVTNLGTGTPLGAHVDAFRIMRDTATADQIRKSLPHLPAGISDEAAREWARAEAYRDAKIFGGHNGATDLAGKEAQVLAGKRITPQTPGEGRTGPTGNFLGDVANLGKEALLGTPETADRLATSPKDVFGQSGVGGGLIDWITGKKNIPGTNTLQRQADTWSPLAAGRVAGTNVEDFFRLAKYLGEVKSGATGAEAGRQVNRLHFDYDALAPFEKKVMRRAIPFYTFGRKNLPLQADRLVHTPGAISAQLRPAQPTNEDQFTPEHMASGIAIPVGKEEQGQQRYISQLGLPVEEAFERLKFKDNLPDIKGTALAYAGMLNPAIKGPLEQLFNTQFHSNRKLTDLHPTAFGRTIGNASGGYLGDDSQNLITQVIANTPATRFATSLDKLLDSRKGALPKALNLLTGVKVSDVDTGKARAVEARNALEDVLDHSPHVAKYTNFYVRPGELPNLNPTEIERMRMLALLQQRARAYADQQRRLAAQ